MSKSLSIIDTTLRDGQQSLWAMNMRTGTMLAALDRLDRAGFEAMEFYVPVVQIKKMIRDLGEDPFQWLRLGTQKTSQTPLRLHAGYRSGLGKIPESVAKLLVKLVIDTGISVARVSDPWNDFDGMREEHDELRKMGMESVVNLIYSVSPRHTDEYFIARVRKAAALKPYRLCLKDVGGLLTPDRIDTLLPQIKEAAGGIPIEFHCHCNNGLGPYNVVKVLQHGLTHVHSALPPLANGSSQPSVFNVVANARELGFDPGIDEAPLREASEFLTGVADRDGFSIGHPVEYEEHLYSHQVPGGMISNLYYQLAKVKQEHRLPEVLEEAANVRRDFGYPIMVTPLSQFVGTQAAVNVMTGSRYGQVTDETIQYALGHWGREALEHMDADARDRILDRARAKELAAVEYAQPSLDEVRRHYGESLSDEDLILRVYVDEEAPKIARNAPEPKEEALAGNSLVELVRNLTSIRDKATVTFVKGNTRIALARNRA
ncbi:hypothetical protein [Amorphus sp. 3PC139-8]|uniref:hypothetical protein n=1 Tax=Amorphus sp. 3PC139-8 TaxID=2735676 RepID=UPI00345C711C